jgi:hypothetical protein
MQVRADLSDSKIELGNNGLTLTISDNEGKHVGHLRIGQATVEWRKGRTRAGNGKKLPLTDLIAYLNSL